MLAQCAGRDPLTYPTLAPSLILKRGSVGYRSVTTQPLAWCTVVFRGVKAILVAFT